ncbi:MAG: methyltransferase [Deltaproteobacteria bacterium]|nr:MAG: methyltransferase [Deltaproteobacteria bacterium]
MMWQDIAVAPSGTHHIRGGVPLYADRFDQVLKFHAPGLAAVRRGKEAWHIRVDGSPAYGRRFVKTFGFYEGLAAVVSPDGWHHIRTDGTDLYRERYEWCGNFQGGRCAVRQPGGAYFHITSDGEPAYEARWKYAGDYRDGVAVVQGKDGRSTHIDLCGALIHGVWFLDLDVFHKGFARARDDNGWTHVDTSGRPAYQRRFAGVEPFYNGQARVERFDGGLEVIDTSGTRVVELRPALRSEFASLSSDLVGFWRTYTAVAAAELDIVGMLPESTEQIAHRAGLTLRSAQMLLRAMGEMGLVTEEGDTWNATEKGALLDQRHPMSLHSAAIEYARHMVAPWRDLLHILAGDRLAGRDLFQVVADDAERVERFHRMLSSYALHDYSRIGEAINLEGEKTLIDAGGGTGIVAGFLLRAHPSLRVVLMDRPEVLRQVALPTELLPRFRAVAGDLFAPWPVRGDAVLLARVLHDWDDDRCLRILHHARAALDTGGVLFVVEMLLEPGDFNGSLCTLHLLVNTGGSERTLDEYRAMLDATGFDLQELRRLDTLPTVLRGVAR